MATDAMTTAPAPKLSISADLINLGRQVMSHMGSQAGKEWVSHLLQYLPSKPELATCTPESLAGALSTGCNLGLSLASHEFAMIARKNSRNGGRIEANFQLEYRGALKLARRGARSTRITVQVVYERDVFSIEQHMSPPFVHTLHLGDDRGDVIGCYCVGLIDGEWSEVEWMTTAQIRAHAEQYSEAFRKDAGPWTDPLARLEMMRKTLLIRWCKRAPMPDEYHHALAAEYATSPLTIDATPAPMPAPPQLSRYAQAALESATDSVAPVAVPEREPARVVNPNDPDGFADDIPAEAR